MLSSSDLIEALHEQPEIEVFPTPEKSIKLPIKFESLDNLYANAPLVSGLSVARVMETSTRMYEYNTSILRVPGGYAVADILIQKENMKVKELNEFAEAQVKNLENFKKAFGGKQMPYYSLYCPVNGVNIFMGEQFKLMFESQKPDEKREFPYAAGYSEKLQSLNTEVLLLGGDQKLLAGIQMISRGKIAMQRMVSLQEGYRQVYESAVMKFRG